MKLRTVVNKMFRCLYNSYPYAHLACCVGCFYFGVADMSVTYFYGMLLTNAELCRLKLIVLFPLVPLFLFTVVSDYYREMIDGRVHNDFKMVDDNKLLDKLPGVLRFFFRRIMLSCYDSVPEEGIVPDSRRWYDQLGTVSGAAAELKAIIFLSEVMSDIVKYPSLKNDILYCVFSQSVTEDYFTRITNRSQVEEVEQDGILDCLKSLQNTYKHAMTSQGHCLSGLRTAQRVKAIRDAFTQLFDEEMNQSEHAARVIQADSRQARAR